jgi:hypothetical protein
LIGIEVPGARRTTFAPFQVLEGLDVRTFVSDRPRPNFAADLSGCCPKIHSFDQLTLSEMVAPDTINKNLGAAEKRHFPQRRRRAMAEPQIALCGIILFSAKKSFLAPAKRV